MPADMRLFQIRDIQVDESALTGESVPVHKKSEILEHDTGLADRQNMAYASTLVIWSKGSALSLPLATKQKWDAFLSLSRQQRHWKPR